MFTLRSTATFKAWVDGLKDRTAAARIFDRLVRVQNGNLGDVKSIGGGVSEMRINYGPGYRLYFIREELTLIILLCGGDKSSQARDIAQAKRLAKEWKD